MALDIDRQTEYIFKYVNDTILRFGFNPRMYELVNLLDIHNDELYGKQFQRDVQDRILNVSYETAIATIRRIHDNYEDDEFGTFTLALASLYIGAGCFNEARKVLEACNRIDLYVNRLTIFCYESIGENLSAKRLLHQPFSVPEYCGNSESLSKQQEEYLHRWRTAWKQGKALDVAGQTAYISYYIEHVVRHLPAREMDEELSTIHVRYGDDQNCQILQFIVDCYIASGRFNDAISFISSIQSTELDTGRIVADCYILLARYEDALCALEHSTWNYRNLIWDLKRVTGKRVRGHELIDISKLTSFGKRNMEGIADVLDRLLELYEDRTGTDLITAWASISDSFFFYKVMHGWTYRRSTQSTLRQHDYSGCSSLHLFSKRITRLAENAYRSELGIPYVGEKWIGETELYYWIKYMLSEFEVLRHHSPYWLGRQHLDIFIPDLNVAIEYQGLQHDEPVEFFGGQAAFEKRKQLDARKKRLCQKYRVALIYVRPGYQLQDVLDTICLSSGRDLTFKSPNYTDISHTVEEQLLGLDPKEEPSPPTYDYQLEPEYEIEPIEFDLKYEVSTEVVDQYYELGKEIAHRFANDSSDPDSLDIVVDLCKQQIALGFDMAQYCYKQGLKGKKERLRRARMAKDTDSKHFFERYAERLALSAPQTGYYYLVEILKKQGKFHEALWYAVKAKTERWPEESTNWDKTIVNILGCLET